MTAVLEVRDLQTEYELEGGTAYAVSGVSFTLHQGRVLGLVGESGCGKSATALSLMRLLPALGRVTAGSVRLAGRELLTLSEQEMQGVRGAEMAMVFQEPMTALNPVFTVGNQIAEAVWLHRRLGWRDAWARAVELLAEVGIPDPSRRARDYPHQLSGGMRQRVMIAIAIACEPRVLIADEPTTALDVTIQAEILDLLRSLREKRGMAILLITHDLGVVAEEADEVAIMYAGRIIEYAAVGDIFAHPQHPYTRALLRAVPGGQPRGARLEAIAGTVPDLLHLPSGCAFRPRCALAVTECAASVPPLLEKTPRHPVACIKA